MPKMAKKSFQNDWRSADSEVARRQRPANWVAAARMFAFEACAADTLEMPGRYGTEDSAANPAAGAGPTQYAGQVQSRAAALARRVIVSSKARSMSEGGGLFRWSSWASRPRGGADGGRFIRVLFISA